MICFGHRGAKGYEPENTLLSIRKAMKLGVHGIEIDIHAAHGELLVLHDSWLPIGGTKKQLSHLPLSELLQIDVGKGEKIPRLIDVLNAVDGKVILNIEIKGEGCVPLLVPILQLMIARGYQAESLLVSSFHHRELLSFYKAMPEIARGLLLYGVPLRILEDAQLCGCSSVHLHIESVSEDIVAALHNAGLRVYVYTVNAPEEIALMKAIGVDGVFSDYPDRCLR